MDANHGEIVSPTQPQHHRLSRQNQQRCEKSFHQPTTRFIAPSLTSMGGSLRDVQQLARHCSLQMTQKYIEVSEGAMKRVVS
jgi:hypothetical protein